ncbi:MAG: hypothetical protein A3B68_07980 [Candidatus Melainabacteria bacterium RIFCSPHIGHO2_02_FULL_34_12]|nr:MAG: hypothetical protein A3B68_07980 [Candidatus Melainabacteria bacterium RIFCSPHIGHO2_02_FULL_34_12]
MSIGLCMSKIAEYQSKHADALSEVDGIQGELLAASESGNRDPEIKQKTRQLAAKQAIVRMLADFLGFWKDALKSILEMLKSLNELAFGR